MLACQVFIPLMVSRDERDAHVRRIATKVDEFLSTARVDIVVLPELSTIDYSRAAFSSLDMLAEEVDGTSATVFGEIARRHGVQIIFGMPRREGKLFFISQVLLGSEGICLGTYDKIHIAQFGASMEKEYFQRGQHTLTFELNGFRISPIICYDIRFPELLRTLCDNDRTDVILHCGAYARDESYYSWHQFAVTRAMENMVWLVSLNRAGSFYGRSIVCPPWIDELHPEVIFPDDEVFRLITLGRADLVEARGNYPFLRDRLPDYHALSTDVVRCRAEGTAV
ncbi:carbon-nitrogen hydrolase family protein [Aestuariivirga sp.]|uniref:carbon-nitrogen hydrolase family protein n=1 Tax=Aestuariivirga sp. TaxID=2650926 RepID=UPI00391A8B9F